MQVCDVSAVLEKILEGKGHNVITLHDINFESLSKFLWMWAKSGSIHDETAEFKNELLLWTGSLHMCKLEDTWTNQEPRAVHSATQNPFDVALKLRRV